jgi:RNA polymerase sigma-70 factor (ECF subfamily)
VVSGCLRGTAVTSADAGFSDRADLERAVAAAAGGDDQAFRLLYQALQPGILRYLYLLVGDDAEDVASETWFQITRDLHAYREEGGGFRAWAVSIARHRAMDHLRRHRRRPAVAGPVEDFEPRAGAGNTSAEAIEAVSTKAAIAWIATLPREQAEAILLRVVIGLDAESAARVLGKRAGAVRTAAYRGLRTLAERLEGHQVSGPSSKQPPQRPPPDWPWPPSDKKSAAGA